MRSIVVAAVVTGAALTGAAARAPETALPRYDVEKQCGLVSRGQAKLQNLCRSKEQTSYDRLKAAWLNLPEATRAECVAYAGQFDRQAYERMEACVRYRWKFDAGQEPGPFRY